MTAAEIRAKYPNPVSADVVDQHDRKAYCVLGAACLYSRRHAGRFPADFMAAAALGITDLSANRIARANDFGHFDRAWSLLDRALKAKK